MIAYIDLSDGELSGLLKQGDHAAFSEIFNRYNSLLYVHAYRKLKDREAAKDIVQDVMTTIWSRHAKTTFGDNLGGYLYSAVRNKIFDLLSHQQVANKHIASLQFYLDKNNTITDYLIREKQLAAIIEKEIAALPPRMREIFQLSRKENLSHKEIAAKLAISEQTVTDQVKKALRILRPKIGMAIAMIFFIQS